MSDRIQSIDVFRGFTIFMMVFVNDVAGVGDIPGWMKHIPSGVNGMTFVDVVFPAFLFIVGMAIPFSVKNRLSKNSNQVEFWLHILTRTVGLLVLGIYMVNAEEMNKEANLISAGLWSALLYVAAILVWNEYPAKNEKYKNLYILLKGLGILILVILYFTYRKGDTNALTGMTTSWWGILGLIGWAYGYAVILFMISKQKLLYISIAFALLLILILSIMWDPAILPSWLDWINGQRGHFVHTLIVLSGLLCSLLLKVKALSAGLSSAIRNIILLGLLFLLVGFLTRSFGIAKIGSTPTWGLYSASICCFLFAVIYWLVDIKKISRWANFLKPAGQNPLLTYILPFLFYAIIAYDYSPEILNFGIPGIIRSIVFSLIILWIAKWLTSRGIRLHL